MVTTNMFAEYIEQCKKLLILTEYCITDGHGDSRQLAQLEILYKAKCSKLDDVTDVLKSLKEESDREIRVLKHRISLLQGAMPGLIITFYD